MAEQSNGYFGIVIFDHLLFTLVKGPTFHQVELEVACIRALANKHQASRIFGVSESAEIEVNNFFSANEYEPRDINRAWSLIRRDCC